MKFLITETQYSSLFSSLLNESQEYLYKPKVGCETYTPGKGCDPYQYLKVVDGSKTNYYYKLEKDQNWKMAKNLSGITSIEKNVIFNDIPSKTPILNKNKSSDGNPNINPKPNEKKTTSPTSKTCVSDGITVNAEKIKFKDKTKPQIDLKKLFSAEYKKVGKTYPEIDKIIKKWMPTFDPSYLCKTAFNGKTITPQDLQSWDWDINNDEYGRNIEKYYNIGYEKAVKKGYDGNKFADGYVYFREKTIKKLDDDWKERYNLK